jgi:hypothetical protein
VLRILRFWSSAELQKTELEVDSVPVIPALSIVTPVKTGVHPHPPSTWIPFSNGMTDACPSPGCRQEFILSPRRRTGMTNFYIP